MPTQGSLAPLRPPTSSSGPCSRSRGRIPPALVAIATRPRKPLYPDDKHPSDLAAVEYEAPPRRHVHLARSAPPDGAGRGDGGGVDRGGPSDLLGLRGHGRPLALRVRRPAVRPGRTHPGAEGEESAPQGACLHERERDLRLGTGERGRLGQPSLRRRLRGRDREPSRTGSSGTRRAIGSSSPTTRTCG